MLSNNDKKWAIPLNSSLKMHGSSQAYIPDRWEMLEGGIGGSGGFPLPVGSGNRGVPA
jgi:hypothetical protein